MYPVPTSLFYHGLEFGDTIDNGIQGLETVKITGFISISRFRKSVMYPGQGTFVSFAEKIVRTFARSGYPKDKNTFNNKKRHLWSNSIQHGYI